MKYILDTNCFIICGHYFPSRFPTFWQQFNDLVSSGVIVSVREVRNELDNLSTREHLQEWIHQNRQIFLLPEPEETEFVSQIFSIPHFQQLIGKKQQLSGRPVADPFVIASAYTKSGIVVTEESLKPNGANIPNVCDHFDVEYISIEELMARENWEF